MREDAIDAQHGERRTQHEGQPPSCLWVASQKVAQNSPGQHRRQAAYYCAVKQMMEDGPSCQLDQCRLN